MMFKKLIGAVILFESFSAVSGSVLNTTISELEFAQSQENLVLIKADGNKSDCSTPGSWKFVLETDTDYGKQMLSAILAAHASGKTVSLKGYSTPVCGYVGLEELNKINIY